jgi:TolB-like protein/Flp pilus assembly protein TadD
LLERPGDLVTREALRARLWPQTIVDFDHGVNKAISKIRDALGDSAESPRFIETVASRGYRFLADVAVIADRLSEKGSGKASGLDSPELSFRIDGGPPAKRRAGNRAWWATSLGLACALAGAIAWNYYSRQHAAPALSSLAVLPFQNFSGDSSQEYFADGMTDELITDLGQISALRVISRTSAMPYKDARKPLAEIASELKVQAVVEGSVLRSGDRVRINAQLIRVPADQQIWAHSYEGNIRDTLTLQSQVAQAIAQQIGITLTQRERKALQSSRPVNPAAYEGYLKGRYFWNKRNREDLAKAIVYFSGAIEADPTYAETYSGLADAYALSGDWEYGVLSPEDAFTKARTAANRALELDDSLSDAHTSLAFVLDLYGWDWDAAEREYKMALQLNPSYATAHQWYAWHLLVTGRNREGIFELRLAESLDPLSLIISADLADALCIAHLYDEAMEQSRKTLEINPDFALAHYELGQAYEQKQMHAEAIAEFHRAIALAGHSSVFDSNLGYALAVSGQRKQALSLLGDMQARGDQNPSAQANIALVYVGLGDPDRAMAWLNKAYAARFNPSILLRPGFDALRTDSRFKDLRSRIGLPQ